MHPGTSQHVGAPSSLPGSSTLGQAMAAGTTPAMGTLTPRDPKSPGIYSNCRLCFGGDELCLTGEADQLLSVGSWGYGELRVRGTCCAAQRSVCLPSESCESLPHTHPGHKAGDGVSRE